MSKTFARFSLRHKNVTNYPMSASDADELVCRERFFSAGNVQAVKLIANRIIYGCDFHVVRAWYAFSVTRIFATDGRTVCEGRKKKQNKEYRKVDIFFTIS